MTACSSKRGNVSIGRRLRDVQVGGVLVAHFHWIVLCHLHWTDLCHLHWISSRHPDQLQVRPYYYSKHSRWHHCASFVAGKQAQWRVKERVIGTAFRLQGYYASETAACAPPLGPPEAHGTATLPPLNSRLVGTHAKVNVNLLKLAQIG